MNVLVLCETSGTVRRAFWRRGHNAISVDVLPSDDNSIFHVQSDIFDFLKKWEYGVDLIVAHPPCTALCCAGNKTYGAGQEKHDQRLASAKWTNDLWNLCKSKAPKVCLENPVGVLARLTDIPKATYVQPYQFGHREQKKTGLHLFGLEPLMETDNVYDDMMLLPKKDRERLHYLGPSADRWKIRSKTFEGIAKAMADQWG